MRPSRELLFHITAEDEGDRLDLLLGQRPEVGSRSRAATLIEAGKVRVGGIPRPKSYRPVAGEAVWVELDKESPFSLAPEDIPVPIVYEDDWLLVVDKPAGMVVHPSKGHPSGTLVNALVGHGLAGGTKYRPGVVHRLDRDTSGLLVVAKDATVHRELVRLMRGRGADRRYLALVHGHLGAATGTIEAPVGRDHVRRKTMTVGGAAPRDAVTHFRVLERLRGFSLVEARLETGRTHQIRVHFLAIGHPVAGDPAYARRDPLGIGRQFLHSYLLTFLHPATGAEIRCEAALPDELARVLTRLRAVGQEPL